METEKMNLAHQTRGETAEVYYFIHDPKSDEGDPVFDSLVGVAAYIEDNMEIGEEWSIKRAYGKKTPCTNGEFEFIIEPIDE